MIETSVSLALKIEGMRCAHCAMRVQQALKKVRGVKNATVSLASETALLEYDAQANVEAMKAAVDEARYTVAGSRKLNSIHSHTAFSTKRLINNTQDTLL